MAKAGTGSSAGRFRAPPSARPNSFEGSLDVRYADDAFQEDGEHFDDDLQERKNLDVGVTIGGPILRDRLWPSSAGRPHRRGAPS